MKNFFNFKYFITPMLIKWIWFFVSLASIMAGIQRVIVGFNSYGPGLFDSGALVKPNVSMIMGGLALIIAVPLVLRIFAEMIYNNFTKGRQ